MLRPCTQAIDSKFQFAFLAFALLLIGSIAPLEAQTDCNVQVDIPATQCEALVAFADSTNIENWVRSTNWLQDNEPCRWYGVSCVDGAVDRLLLSNNNLTGTLPPELGQLTDLRIFNLQFDDIGGSIPAEMGQMVSLERFSFAGQQLTGSLPPELSQLSLLTEIGLAGNQLTGSIPAEFAILTNLRRIDLNQNLLSGTIPSELSGMTGLKELFIGNNPWNQDFPLNLLGIQNLENLSLINSGISSSIPSSIDNLTALRELDLSDNLMTGLIPTELGSLSNLTSLKLSNNQFSGPIPESLGSIALQELIAAGNLLSGPLLGGLFQPALRIIDLQGNQLTGNIPNSINAITEPEQLYLQNNQLSGSLPLPVATWIAGDFFFFDCDLTGNTSNLCIPNTPEFVALGLDPMCGIPLTECQDENEIDNADRGPLTAALDALAIAYDQDQVNIANAILMNPVYNDLQWENFFREYFEIDEKVLTQSLIFYLQHPLFFWGTEATRIQLQNGLFGLLENLARSLVIDEVDFIDRMSNEPAYSERVLGIYSLVARHLHYGDDPEPLFLSHYEELFMLQSELAISLPYGSTNPAFSALKTQLLLSVRDLVERTPALAVEVAAMIDITNMPSGEEAVFDMWNDYGLLFIDGHNASSEQLTFVEDLLAKTPSSLVNMGSITMNGFFGTPAFPYFRGVDGMDLPLDPIGGSQSNPFPPDMDVFQTDFFASVTSYFLGHSIRSTVVDQTPELADRQDWLILAAGPDSLNYLTSTVANDFFLNYPFNFVPFIAQQYIANSQLTFEHGAQRFDDGKDQPINQFLFFANIFSEGGSSTWFYETDSSGTIIATQVGLERNPAGLISLLTFDDGTKYSFEWNSPGFVTAINIDYPSGGTGGSAGQNPLTGGAGGFDEDFEEGTSFGSSVTGIGDLDGDGVEDAAVGAVGRGANNRGSVFILFFNADGSIKSEFEIIPGAGGLMTSPDSDLRFGSAVTEIGDLDGDGVIDLVVGASDYDESRGSLWVLFMNSDGSVKNYNIISRLDGFFGSLEINDAFGWSLASYGDYDLNGLQDLLVGSPGDSDGGPDRGAVWLLSMNADGSTGSGQLYSDTSGGFDFNLTDGDRFGSSVLGLGYLDGDGVLDVAVGASGDNSGDGAVWSVFLNSDLSVKNAIKNTQGGSGFAPLAAEGNAYGSSLAVLGDLNMDGVNDIVVGAPLDDEAGDGYGAIFTSFMATDGSISDEVKISESIGGFGGNIQPGDSFGSAVGVIGDLDNDGLTELVSTAALADNGDTPNTGGAWIISLDVESSLPIVLSSFEVQTDERDLSVNWTTSSEYDNAGFEIQLQSLGKETESWEQLAYVEGRGTRESGAEYSFVKEGLMPAMYKIRLKQIDLDGEHYYSQELSFAIDLPGSHLISGAYPNPFNPVTNFNLQVGLDQLLRIDLFDVNGQLVQSIYDGKLMAGSVHQFTINGSALSSGLYFYRVVGETFAESRSVQLIK